ncbi:MAG: pilus assembly protein MshP [Desulfuromonadales bacterium]|nr:pilus assembly protein MshP [Desulfuromonadales bacterium]MBN2793148.1 pilus assembly protein MshP [Desulfuromonadales bacterium]
MSILQQNNQRGFTLVQAIFVLVVLGLLGVAMMRLSGVQSSTGVFALQGARAYQAARSGLEWGAAQAGSGVCNPSPGNDLSVDNFNVNVSCTSQSFDEGSGSYNVYRISALATFGSYGSPDYISRRIEMKVGFQ